MILYLINRNFLLVSKILFLSLFLITSCQLDQSLDKIRSTLFDSEESEQIIDEEEQKRIEDDEFVEENQAEEIKIKEEKVTQEKKIESKLFSSEKNEEDRRILDFFSGFITSGDGSENITLDELNKENKKRKSDTVEKLAGESSRKNKITKIEPVKEEKIILKMPNTNSETSKSQKQDFLEEVDKKPAKKEREILEEKIQDDFVNKENLEDDVSANENLEDKSFAFFDLQRPKKELEKNIKKKNNYVGLLLPLTGDKRSAGSLVLNTFRYSLAKKPMDIVFKIYDTKGTVEGAIDAALKGKKDNVETFIGPIFSYETKALKQRFSNDDKIVFFSLSPDLTNVSNNIIVSGQNPEDQIACIVSDLKTKAVNDLLVIHHRDRYGDIIKQSVQKNLETTSLGNFNLSFLEIDKNKDLNKEIKAISNFERRKKNLKVKRNQISNDKSISK